MLLDFYFDYSSPFAYLAATQIERVAREAEATLTYRPFLLGGLFKSIGTANVPLFEMPQSKQRYQRLDMQRWAHHLGVPFRFPSRFPMNTVTALRLTLALDEGARGPFITAVCRAYWADDRDIADRDELEAVATACGLAGPALLARADDPALKDALRRATEAAEAVGVCGAPSFRVRRDEADEGMLFWGQDRLELVAEALNGWRPSCG